MIFVFLLIDKPKPIELVVVDSHPDVVETPLEAINITDFFRLSGQIISESAQRLESGLDKEPKMNASSFRLTKNLGIITGKKICWCKTLLNIKSGLSIAVFFVSGATPTPTKLQNSTNCG